MKRPKKLVYFVGNLCLLFMSTQGEAVVLKPGDILVNPGGPDRVEVIDPTSGVQSTISQGGFWSNFGTIRDLAVLGTEKIYTVGTVDLLGGGFAMGVVEVDPANGEQRLVTSGGNIKGVGSVTIAVEADGSILVADHRCCNPGQFGGGVIRINPVTGGQTVIGSGGFLTGASGIHVGPNGDIFVGTLISGSGDGVVRINPDTGAQSVVAFGDEPGVPPIESMEINSIKDLTVDKDGILYVMDERIRGGGSLRSEIRIIQVNPNSGQQTLLTRAIKGLVPDENNFDHKGIDVFNKDIFIIDYEAPTTGNPGVTKFDADFGFRQHVASTNFSNPSGLSVVQNGATKFLLQVTPTGTGIGTVTSSPVGISCGGTCSAMFTNGTDVTLTASPSSTFAGWSGGCTETAQTCTVSMTTALTVTATFNPINPIFRDLTVTKVGTGSGTVTSNPVGISCGSTCSALFTNGTDVILTASPSSTFAGWSGGCTGTTQTCSVTLNAPQTVTATFLASGVSQFSQSDLTGTWRFHGNTIGVSPSGNSAGAWGTVTFDSSGTLVQGNLVFATGGGDVLTGGNLTLSTDGKVTGSLAGASATRIIEGTITPDKTQIWGTLTIRNSQGVDFFIGTVSLVKQTGQTFTQQDLTGTWRTFRLVTRPDGTPFWLKGEQVLNSSGALLSGELTVSNGTTFPLATGAFSVDSSGIVSGLDTGVNSTRTYQATMTPSKDQIVGTVEVETTQGTPLGFGLVVFVKTPGAGFTTSDMAGEWQSYRVSNMGALSPLLAVGTHAIDGAGVPSSGILNFNTGVVVPLNSGNFGISPSGDVSGMDANANGLVSREYLGAMTADTNQVISVITIQDTQGNVVRLGMGVYVKNSAVAPSVGGSGPDVNGDGRADLFWRNTNNGATHVWQMTASGTRGPVTFPGGLPTNWQIQAVADVNGDGRADLVWRNTTNGATHVWQMTAGGLRGPVTFPGGLPTNWHIQAVADVNGDGRADIIWRNTNNGATHVWQMTASGTRGPVTFPGGLPLNWQIQDVADVNGDGRADVVWRNTNNGATHVWQMTANATRGPVTFPGGLPLNWEIQNVADVNSDGRADVVWRNTNNGATHVWQMTANATRGPVTFPGGLPLNWEIQNVADVNGDGRADVIWRNTNNGATHVWQMTANATRGPVTFPGGLPTNWELQP